MLQSLCIVVLFAVSASTMSLRLPEDTHKAILEKCNNALELTESLVDDLLADPEPLLRDPKTRCYAACFLMETKVLKSDGTLNAKRVIEYMPNNVVNREEVTKAFITCANEKGVDSCETAYNTIACLNRNDVIRNIHRSL